MQLKKVVLERKLRPYNNGMIKIKEKHVSKLGS